MFNFGFRWMFFLFVFFVAQLIFIFIPAPDLLECSLLKFQIVFFFMFPKSLSVKIFLFF